MKHISLGGLDVSRIGLGTMAMSGYYLDPDSSDAESIRTIQRALDLGVTLIDTAEIYGPYANEELVGRALKGRRDEVVRGDEVRLGLARRRRRPECSTAARRTSGPPSRAPSSDWAPTTSTSTTSTASTRTRRSRTPSAPWPSWWPRERSGTSACPRPGPTTIRRAHAVHPITALQTEYSLWTRDPEAELLPLLRELGIGFVPYSPLGHGFLTGTIRSPEELADDDWRKTNPRFTEGNFEKNLRIVDEVQAVASELDATPAQVALAWLLAQGDDIAPIPGTKRVSRVEENTAADGIELTAEQIQRLNDLTPATGERHEEANMATIDR